MRKVINSLLIAFMLFSSLQLSARNVSELEAKDAAVHFMLHNTYMKDITIDDVVLVHQIDNPTLGIPACYFFNIADQGWIIMAANTTTEPVIGFSDICALDPERLPDNMMWYVNSYVEMVIDQQILDNEKGMDDIDEWTDLFNHNLKGNTKDAQVVLMFESWDQGDPYDPSYNLYCPKVDNLYSYTGCVATAIAQICHYYKFPVNPRGRTSYNWNGQTLGMKFDTVFFNYSQMPNRLSGSSTMAQKRAVAQLNYALGVAVHMGYSPEGSGAYSAQVPSAMNNYFKYKRGKMTYRANVTTDEYMALIRGELEKRRPVYMGGASSTGGDGRDAAGHAWLCAGYMSESDSRYFMNWGWGGSANGFFNLRSNNMPAQGYNFNQNQECITGIIPPDADSTDIDFVAIDEVSADAAVGSVYPNPAVFSVTLPYSLTAAADLCIYSIDGRLVESRSLTPGEGNVVVNVSHMPAGIYIYRLGSASGKFVVR